MARSHYKIPFDLNASYGDMTVTIKSNDGIGLKPVPIKVICAYLLSFMLCFLVLSKTVVSSASFGQKALFCILWLIMTLVLFKYDSTRRMQIELIPTLMSYVPKSNRYVSTQTSGDATGFYNIANIRSIGKSGLVEFTDGTFGYFYRVVGSASVLLFESDKNAILNRVDSFYRKMNTEAECIFITTKSSQTVYKQVLSLKKRYDNLKNRDPELLELAEEQFRCLKNYVGSSFKSIHQYMVIKADNKEMLMQTKNVLQSEVENSTLMIKRCIPMYGDDITILLELIFRGKGR